MAKCEHNQSRRWQTEKGPVRRCRDCGVIRPLSELDKQLIGEKK